MQYGVVFGKLAVAVSQEIPCFLWNLKVHDNFNNSPQLVSQRTYVIFYNMLASYCEEMLAPLPNPQT